MARLENGNFCPLIKENCKGIDCVLYTHVRGADPQSGQEVDEYACAIAWLPVLLINTAKEVRQGAAATESMRNEMAQSADKSFGLQLAIARQGLTPLALEKKDGS